MVKFRCDDRRLWVSAGTSSNNNDNYLHILSLKRLASVFQTFVLMYETQV